MEDNIIPPGGNDNSRPVLGPNGYPLLTDEEEAAFERWQAAREREELEDEERYFKRQEEEWRREQEGQAWEPTRHFEPPQQLPDVPVPPIASDADPVERGITQLVDYQFEKDRPADHAALMKQTAKAKGVSVQAIKAEVRARRDRRQKPAEKRRNLKRVDGILLLNGVHALVQKHLLLPPGAAVAITLWAVHTHAFDASRNSPRLAFTAPMENCGKTTGLDLLNQFCSNPRLTSHTTAPAMFRRVTLEQTTLLIDEGENYLDGPEYVVFLNSGHNRSSANYDRCDKNAQGDYTAGDYSTWTPVAFARVGTIPQATLRSRCIIINMKRARLGEEPKKLHHTPEAQWKSVQAQMSDWAQANMDALRKAEPAMGSLDNRAADNWRPLFAIADAAGGEWPKLARQAAEHLTEARQLSQPESLLAAIKRAFEDRQTLGSLDLCKALAADLEFDGADAYSAIVKDQGAGRRLNQDLAPFNIRTRDIADGKGSSRKGFRRDQFEEVFERYLPNKQYKG